MAGFDLNSIFEQVQKMQASVEQAQSEAAKKELTASAGGGMVTASVNGLGLVTNISIEPEVVDVKDIEMLQDLVKAATNEAIKKSKDLMKEEAKKLTSGLPIPQQMLSNIFGNNFGNNNDVE